MYLILTTVPHIFSVLPVIKYYKSFTFGYCNVIVLSTTSSMLYHLYDESNKYITLADYGFAGVWFLYDIYMGYKYTSKKKILKILLANVISFTINIKIQNDINYNMYHSMWHIKNSLKCLYVSNIINTGLFYHINI